MRIIKRSVATAVSFLLVDSTSHIAGLAGLSPTVTLCRVATADGTVTESTATNLVTPVDATNAPGWYKVLLTSTETSIIGDLILSATATGADPSDRLFCIQSADITDIDTLITTLGSAGSGLTAIANIVWEALASDHIATTGSFGQVLAPSRIGTAQGGNATTIILDAGAQATTDYYTNAWIRIVAGRGIGQTRLITGYISSTKTATVFPSLKVTPDTTSVFIIIPSAQMGVDKSGYALLNTPPDLASIVAGVWDEAPDTHNLGNNYGYFLNHHMPTVTEIRSELDTNSTKLANLTGLVALEASVVAIPTSPLLAVNYTAPPSTSSIATAVWGSATRTLTGFGTLVSDLVTAVWGATTRTLSAFGFTVPATISDKSGYSLATAPPTSATIVADIEASSKLLKTNGVLSNVISTVNGKVDVNIVPTVVDLSTVATTADMSTLLGRMTSTRASNLDNLDKAISTVATGMSLAEHNHLMAIPTEFGSGNVLINHNYSSSDYLRFIDSNGNGIDNAIINIYLKSEYIIGNSSESLSRGSTTTTVDGRWKNSIRVDQGFVYIVEFYKQGSFQISTIEITT